jgi:hypothetical protein
MLAIARKLYAAVRYISKVGDNANIHEFTAPNANSCTKFLSACFVFFGQRFDIADRYGSPGFAVTLPARKFPHHRSKSNPRKQTCAVQRLMSALGQKRTFCHLFEGEMYYILVIDPTTFVGPFASEAEAYAKAVEMDDTWRLEAHVVTEAQMVALRNQFAIPIERPQSRFHIPTF